MTIWQARSRFCLIDTRAWQSSRRRARPQPARSQFHDGSVVAEACSEPTVQVLSDGRVIGPQVGRGVIQWPPSTENDGILRAGRLAASFDLSDFPMRDFVATVFKIAYKQTDSRLIGAGPIEGPVELDGPVA